MKPNKIWHVNINGQGFKPRKKKKRVIKLWVGLVNGKIHFFKGDGEPNYGYLYTTKKDAEIIYKEVVPVKISY